jgi:hypothetical protein
VEYKFKELLLFKLVAWIGTQMVNVLPTTGQVTTGPGGVEMIVVSQGVVSSQTTSSSTSTSIAGGTKTIFHTCRSLARR